MREKNKRELEALYDDPNYMDDEEISRLELQAWHNEQEPAQETQTAAPSDALAAALEAQKQKYWDDMLNDQSS